MSLRVATRSNPPIDQLEGWLICLRAAQLEMTSLVLLHCYGWQLIDSMAGWWYGGRGESSHWNFSKMTKCVNEWNIHMWSCKHTPTCLTTRRPKQSKTHAQHDWPVVWPTLVIDHSSTLTTLVRHWVLLHVWVWPILYREHNMYTWSEDLEHDQNMVASMTSIPTCKTFGWNEQARWMQRLTQVHRVNLSVCIQQAKLSREAPKLGAGQNFGGWL